MPVRNSEVNVEYEMEYDWFIILSNKSDINSAINIIIDEPVVYLPVVNDLFH